MRKTGVSLGWLGMVLVGTLGSVLLGLIACDLGGSDEEPPQPERVASIYRACGDEIRMTEVYEYDDGTVPPTASFEVVVTDPDMDSRDVQVDAAVGKLYWTQLEVSTGDYQVWRADLDGTNPELLVDGLERAEQLVLDLDDGKIYWCGEDALANGLIQRANLDGSAFEADFITTGRNYPADLALKLDAPKTLYWCVWDGSDARYEIRKAALDPLSAEADVVTSNSMFTAGMAYHDGYLYWGAPLWNRIYKLPDGGGNADVVEVRIAANVVEIALDVVDGKLYWAHDTSIYQAELDGSGSGTGWWVCLSNDLSGMALLK